VLLKSLEDTARRVVPGTGAVAVEPLSSGLVNESYRVTRAGRAYVLRVEAAEPASLGLDRSWECRVAALAGEAGLGPAIRCCEPASGILVSDWVPGRPWSAAEARQAGNVDALAELLRRVHALCPPLPARVAAPADWIALYAAQPVDENGSAARLAASAAARVARLADVPASAAVLCHSDLHRLNLAVGPRPVLLDWEYAHVADPCWDVAGWIVNNDGDADFAAEFHAAYLRRAPTPAETLRLSLVAWLYDYVAWLWSAVYLRHRPGASVTARAAQLEERLSHTAGGSAAQVTAHYPP
jgi:thiamine kinase